MLCKRKKKRSVVSQVTEASLGKSYPICIAYLLPEQERGGTQYTVAYCGKKNIPVINLAEEK